MSKIYSDYSLKDLNTFCVDVKAKFFSEVSSIEELKELLNDPKTKGLKKLVIGGGSNTLFVNDYDGLVIKNNIMGMNVEREDDKYVYIKSGAGEEWHKLVEYTVNNEWDGIENMGLIPGTVGGAAAQNIAAYGQNLSDVFESLEALNIDMEKVEQFNLDRSNFGYRTSFFKKEGAGKYVILSVVLKLNKKATKLETSYHERKGRYGSLEEELKSFAHEPYTVRDVFDAVIRQRTKRLPSVEDYGTCGSFFVNPIVTVTKYKELTEKINDLQSYPIERLSYERKDWNNVEGEEMVKIPAGRLLDELGWKGKWDGNVGVSEKHALCVVTNKNATGKEILEFTEKMKKSVSDAYGIDLVSEVNIIK